ncbi:2-isopropylmalate synthase [Planctomycetales bacterium]|nr:2-isopropylmalate synthase [Planctomycetales bacterium]
MSAKYQPPAPVKLPARQWADRQITAAPRWASVDLRDGNQAMPAPLSPAEKLAFFQLLVDIGFKEIEVAYPSASRDDFAFTRRLIDGNFIPPDVRVAVLAPCKKDLIARTFAAVRGAPTALIHLYLAVSDLHLQTVLNLSRDAALRLAVEATRHARDLARAQPATDFRYEFSPEEFTDADPDFALTLCTAVFEAWGESKPIIINLPATVERRGPNQFADLVEYFCAKFPYRDRAIISLHPHNDQGMATAAAELGLLAGGERLEGTLFGAGERTGNLDLITFAGNLLARGIDPTLDLSHLPTLVERVQTLTGMTVYPRLPYSGELAFTAFSGTHQDAIRKGMARRGGASAAWRVPYLHVDPSDFGRTYERLIRLTPQSGKGGAAWVLEQNFGIKLPPEFLPALGRTVQKYLDRAGGELSPIDLHEIFIKEFVNPAGPYQLAGYWSNPDAENPLRIHGVARLKINDEEREGRADGNGPVSAFVGAIQTLVAEKIALADYQQMSIDAGADARALSCVTLKCGDAVAHGIGINTNTTQATVRAVVAALNRAIRVES